MREIGQQLLDEARSLPHGSMEWEWRIRAAWKYDQWLRDIAAQDWTEWPPQHLLDRAMGREQIAA